MITFTISESIQNRFVVSNKLELKKWLKNLASFHNYRIIQLNYFFCSDEEILVANKSYLNHDYYTDIITFDLSEKTGEIEGDVLVSVETVYSNAQKNAISFEHETTRVLAHGLLHILGYNDKNKKQQEEMRELENRSIDDLFHVKQRKTFFSYSCFT
jgi:rRNA maturation RNase YbeY